MTSDWDPIWTCGSSDGVEKRQKLSLGCTPSSVIVRLFDRGHLKGVVECLYTDVLIIVSI